MLVTSGAVQVPPQALGGFRRPGAEYGTSSGSRNSEGPAQVPSAGTAFPDRSTSTAPTTQRTITAVMANTGDSVHSTPTSALEKRSPRPFSVASTPKPTPRTVDGSNSAAAEPSTVSQKPM